MDKDIITGNHNITIGQRKSINITGVKKIENFDNLSNEELYKKVSKILKYHIDIRHIRGGESTRNKYLKEKFG